MILHKTIIEKAHCRSTWPKTVAEKKGVGAKCILMSIFKILPDDLHSVANLEINKENEKKNEHILTSSAASPRVTTFANTSTCYWCPPVRTPSITRLNIYKRIWTSPAACSRARNCPCSFLSSPISTGLGTWAVLSPSTNCTVSDRTSPPTSPPPTLCVVQ